MAPSPIFPREQGHSVLRTTVHPYSVTLLDRAGSLGVWPGLYALAGSGSGKAPGECLGGDVVVRGAPHDHAPLEDDDLGRLVFDARPRRDLLRHGALRANVHEIRRDVWVLKEEGFDLAQGRHARRSGRAMFVQERTLRGEDIFQFAFVAHAPHDSLSDIGRDGGGGPIST